MNHTEQTLDLIVELFDEIDDNDKYTAGKALMEVLSNRIKVKKEVFFEELVN